MPEEQQTPRYRREQQDDTSLQAPASHDTPGCPVHAPAPVAEARTDLVTVTAVSYVHMMPRITSPEFGHVWAGSDGSPYATVRAGDHLTLTFGSCQAARDLAAACLAAAEAMEALPPADADGAS